MVAEYCVLSQNRTISVAELPIQINREQVARFCREPWLKAGHNIKGGSLNRFFHQLTRFT